MIYWGKAGAWIALQRLSCIEERRLEVCTPASVTVCGFPTGAGSGEAGCNSWGESASMCWGQVSREGNSWKPWADSTHSGWRIWAKGPGRAPVVLSACAIAPRVNQKDIVSLYVSGHWMLNKAAFSVMSKWALRLQRTVKVVRSLTKQKSSMAVFPMTWVHLKFSRK